jgi:hypothetical protein
MKPFAQQGIHGRRWLPPAKLGVFPVAELALSPFKELQFLSYRRHDLVLVDAHKSL